MFPAALKMFLRDLPNPVIPLELYPRFVAAASELTLGVVREREGRGRGRGKKGEEERRGEETKKVEWEEEKVGEGGEGRGRREKGERRR